MMRKFGRLPELEGIPPEVAWKLLDPLFHPRTAMVGGSMISMALAIIGFLGSRSPWFLVVTAFSAIVCSFRLWHAASYLRHRAGSGASPHTWALKAMGGAWATGLAWGAMTPVILFHPDKNFGILVMWAHAACVMLGAARLASVRLVAAAQLLAAMTPLFFVCAFSGDAYLTIAACCVAISIPFGTTSSKFFNHKMRTLLLREAEKSDLVQQLEAANQEMAVINRHLEALAGTDALTDVANRRTFDLAAAKEWRRLSREAAPMAMILLDVDHFKKYNDRYGHPAGDACLRTVAAAAGSEVCRPGDLLARYGGEEFVVILPATLPAGALVVAEQIRLAVMNRQLAHDAAPLGYVTVSVGVAVMWPDERSVVEQLTARADAALYMAKRSGRNRVYEVGPSVEPADILTAQALAHV